MTNTQQRHRLPVLVLRDTAIFPGVMQQLEIVRKLSVTAVHAAVDAGRDVFVVMQKRPDIDEPSGTDLLRTGVVASIQQTLPGRGGSGAILVRLKAQSRAQGVNYKENEGYLSADVELSPQSVPEDGALCDALRLSLTDLVAEAMRSHGGKPVPQEVISRITSQKTFDGFFNLAANTSPITGAQRQQLLEETDLENAARQLISMLNHDIQIQQLRREIDGEVKKNIDQDQKDYYMREQIHVLNQRLGGDSPEDEAEKYRAKINALDIAEDSRQQLLKVCDKLTKLPSGSHEAATEYCYLDAVLALPWGKMSEESLDVDAAQAVLDRDHFGMEKVKDRILEFIAVRALAPDIKGQIICLAGPPGVGKTSIAKSVASALGRKYQRISLGGVHDEADIRGHRKTYIGAMPGRITNALRLAGTFNPLILLDEVDKLASCGNQGDPVSAMLEVLDPEQNVAFHDHYIDVPLDLSSVMFITTANDPSRIPEPLLDRMEIIELPSYTAEEKHQIAKQHLVKKQLARHGLNGNQLRITAKAIDALISGYTHEAGVRSLEREIASLCRKAAKKVASGCDSRITITDKTLEEYLGPIKYRPEAVSGTAEVGVVNGLAWTKVGGVLLEAEAAVMSGSGKVELTGSLGDVMKESAQAGISYIRSHADELSIDPDFYKTNDIHVHIPEGATPKDGPSAGVTMVTAMVSALTGIPVRGDVAMTGEITLRGRVLAIGGLREKSMAAYSAGISTVIIPADNQPDVAELSDTVRSAINFIPVRGVGEVLENALEHMPSHRA